MTESNWVHLTTIEGRIDADSLVAYLQAEGIDTEIFQEGYGSLVPLTFGPLSRVQVFVPGEKYSDALTLLNNFEEGNNEINQA